MASAVGVRVLRTSSGPVVKAGDRLFVHYQGVLRDGLRQFDASFNFADFTVVPGREPFSFVLGARTVIAGWDEALVGRNLGEILELTIPAAKAYGATGQGSIPPNADLIFKVELLAADPAGPTGRIEPAPEDLGLRPRAARHLQAIRDGDSPTPPSEKIGTDADELLVGTNGVDVLVGLRGDDRLQGRQGADLLIGGRGADRFIYTSEADSPDGESSRDLICDFRSWQGDVIDLQGLPGSLEYIRRRDFSGVAGEVRFSGGLLQADLSGDAQADFEIRLSGALWFSGSSLLL